MAVVREYKAPCGATVRIDDECFWTAEEQAKRKEEADAALGVIFVWSYFSRQAACAREYERRIQDAQIRPDYGRYRQWPDGRGAGAAVLQAEPDKQ